MAQCKRRMASARVLSEVEHAPGGLALRIGCLLAKVMAHAKEVGEDEDKVKKKKSQKFDWEFIVFRCI